MDFFRRNRDELSQLSKAEAELFNYTLRYMHLVKNMTIRDFAQTNFVSTSTVLRFVRKLGFDGWSDFLESVRASEESSRKPLIPDILSDDSYYNDYLKNIIEAVKVLTINSSKMEHFDQIMSHFPNIFILSRGLSSEVGAYACHLLKAIGYDVEILKHDYELYSVMRRIKREDMLLVFSYSGNNATIVSHMEKIISVATPKIVSFTRSDNNIIQNLSDLNFYVFADEIDFRGNDVTSRCAMIAVLEILLYKHVTKQKYSYDHMSLSEHSKGGE